MAAAAVAALASFSYAAGPVVMNVGGEDVSLGEFEYLYNKNKSQQEQPVTLDEYVGMFVDYRMKVLAAKSSGLDTAASFIADINNFARELAEPYLTDSAVVDSLRRETYSRMNTNVEVSHIMLTPKPGATETQQRALLDSLRTVALSGGTTFEELADRYSADPSVKRNHGRLGFLYPGHFPYEIENRAYTMKEGEISEPFATRFGLHIIKRGGERPDPGKIKARHILKLYKNDSTAARRSIDSIYNVLRGGADFAQVASLETDDPSGKQTGGALPWFGSSAMVPEFENAAFALADGEMSEPVATSYGYHIILREATRKPGTFEEEKANIDKMMSRDYRGRMGHERRMQHFASRLGVKKDAEAEARVRAAVEEGGTAAAILRRLKSDNGVAATVGHRHLTVAEVASALSPSGTPGDVMNSYVLLLDKKIDDMIAEQSLEILEKENPEYANLLHEYHDGLLLYEISDAEVWSKANNDTGGLEKFFNAHRTDYRWDKPRFKGLVLMAVDDSVATAARELAGANPSLSVDSLKMLMRRQYNNNVRLERVLAPQGANAVIDYIAFGGPRPAAVGTWTSFAPVRSRVIAQPEEVADVKSQLSVDYQKQLEKDWLERLHKAYKVKIYDKVLRQVK